MGFEGHFNFSKTDFHKKIYTENNNFTNDEIANMVGETGIKSINKKFFKDL